MTDTTEEPQVKNFNIRNIPPKLHHAWKVVAALHDTSMEKLALIAIRQYCKEQVEDLKSGIDVPDESESI